MTPTDSDRTHGRSVRDSLVHGLPTSGNCPICGKYFKGLKIHARSCIAKHSSKCNGSTITIGDLYMNETNVPPNEDLFPYDFSNSFFNESSSDEESVEINDSTDYCPQWLSDLQSFSSSHQPSFNLLHLNINSFHSKFFEVSKIVGEAKYDMLIFEETKLDSSFADDLIEFTGYKLGLGLPRFLYLI